MIASSQIEIINALGTTQFKSFCSTFFHILGLTNINAVLVRENGVVTGKGTIDLGIVMTSRAMDRETDKGLVLTTGITENCCKELFIIHTKPIKDEKINKN